MAVLDSVGKVSMTFGVCRVGKCKGDGDSKKECKGEPFGRRGDACELRGAWSGSRGSGHRWCLTKRVRPRSDKGGKGAWGRRGW
jgi:hypothetical protein